MSGKRGYRFAIEEVDNKREEQERRKEDNLSTGSGQRVKTAKKKSNTSHGNEKPGNSKKEGER